MVHERAPNEWEPFVLSGEVMRDERLRMIQLLGWAKSQGFWPKRFKANDLFVVPIANKLVRWGQLMDYQRSIALWVPSERALRKILNKRNLLGLRVEEQDGVFLANFRNASEVTGAGLDKRVALLSVLNTLRKVGA